VHTLHDSLPALLTRDREDFAFHLEGQATRRSCGQIRDLQVVLLGDRIVLQGRSRTHHAKQLAQEAILDLTGGFPLLANEIVVC